MGVEVVVGRVGVRAIHPHHGVAERRQIVVGDGEGVHAAVRRRVLVHGNAETVGAEGGTVVHAVDHVDRHVQIARQTDVVRHCESWKTITV